MDTGCPNDLTRKALAYKFPYFIHKIQPVIFNTANDAVECSEACSAHLSPLDNDPCDFHLVDESPTVCTVGGRCANRGFWFIWIPYKIPVMITPSMKIVPLDVINDVPYILHKGLHTTLTDPGEIRERCGVYITTAGKVQFDVGASPANAATVAVAAEVADSSSQTVVEAADSRPAAPSVSKESVQA